MLEYVIVHNSNPISPTPSLPLQTTESIDIELSTPRHPNQSQTINNSEFTIYWRKKKKALRKYRTTNTYQVGTWN